MSRYFLLVIFINLISVNGISSTWINISSTEILTSNFSDYCFVNSSIIRRNSDDTQLAIVDDTDDYLVATDGMNFFEIPNDIMDCESDFCSPKLVVYSIQTTVNCIIVLTTLSTIALHLYFKELRNEFGVLVIIFCSTLLFAYASKFIYNRYQFTYKINDNGTVCALLMYIRLTLAFVYHTTVMTIFFHFSYLMYNTYKLRTIGPDLNTKLICKYITFIIMVATVCSLALILYDVMVSRNAFTTVDGHCATGYEEKAKGPWMAILLLFLIVLVVQVFMFGFGVILYFLISRNICKFKSIDIGVCLLLVSTSGLGTLMFSLSYLLNESNSTCIPFLLTSVGTVVRQLILLIITSRKVIKGLSCAGFSNYKSTCIHVCTCVCNSHKVNELLNV